MLKPSCCVFIDTHLAAQRGRCQRLSAIIHFCRAHGLSHSVRARRYGIVGWAVALPANTMVYFTPRDRMVYQLHGVPSKVDERMLLEV